MTPTFTVLVGTIGRPTLRHTLEAFARQDRQPGDQIIVAIDSFEYGARPDVQRLVRSYGPGFEVCAYDSGYHWFGIEQINHALRTVPITGSHVFTMGDDDVFVDDAFATLRPICAASPERPVLYRFLTPPTTPDGVPWRAILWDEPRLAIAKISGCCIAAPAVLVRPFPTGLYREHDFTWIREIVESASYPPIWLDDVLVIARPDRLSNGDVTHRGLWRCPTGCGAWRFREDAPVDTCPACGVAA